MLPFVMLPRPLQESNVVGKGGSAGFLGKGFDPYTLFPEGDDMDMKKMDRIKVDDLKLPPEVFAMRLERRARLREAIEDDDARHRQGRGAITTSTSITQRALEPDHVAAGPAKRSTSTRDRQDARPLRPQHLWPKLSAGAAPGRSRHARRRSHLAEGRQLATTIHGIITSDLTKRMKDQSGPDARQGLRRVHRGHGSSAACSKKRSSSPSANSAAARRRGVSTSGNGNSADGRDHWPYCYTSVVAGAGIKRGYVHGKSDKTGSSPKRSGASDRTARDDVSRVRHRSGNDRLQPPQSAARTGEGKAGECPVRLTGHPVALGVLLQRRNEPGIFAQGPGAPSGIGQRVPVRATPQCKPQASARAAKITLERAVPAPPPGCVRVGVVFRWLRSYLAPQTG